MRKLFICKHILFYWKGKERGTSCDSKNPKEAFPAYSVRPPNRDKNEVSRILESLSMGAILHLLTIWAGPMGRSSAISPQLLG